MADERTDEVETPAAGQTPPTSEASMDKWKDRAIIALVSAIIGLFSGAGGGSVMGGSGSDVATKAAAAEAKCAAVEAALTAHQQADAATLRGIEGKVGDIFEIVDKAHPRQ